MRLRKFGDVRAEVPILARRPPECTFEGCHHPVQGRGLCSSHYSQWWHKKPLRQIAERIRYEGCIHENCGKLPIVGYGLCRMHYYRNRKHGDPSIVLPKRGIRGEQHQWWKGDDITYRAAHRRVESLRGKASNHPCVDCGEPAHEWSYVGGAPDEHGQQIGDYWWAYSLDPDFYQPRCISDHRRFDRHERVSA